MFAKMRFLMPLLFVAGVAAAADVAEFVTACTASSNLGDAICECSGTKAQAEMSPRAFDFLVATLAKDEATKARLLPQLSVEETMKAGTFMMRGPAACGRKKATP